MGDGNKTPLKLNFDPKSHLEFRGATITSDAVMLTSATQLHKNMWTRFVVGPLTLSLAKGRFRERVCKNRHKKTTSSERATTFS